MTMLTAVRRFLLVGSCVACTAVVGCIPSTIGVVAGASGGGGSSTPPAAVIADLALSVGSLSPTFDPDITTYTASVGFLTSRIRFTPSAAAGLSTAVNGVTIPPGQASPAIELPQGVTTIAVRVENSVGEVRVYSIAVTRLPLTGLSQDGPLLKASVPHAGDLLGWSVAIDGNTMVIGALADDGVSRGTAGNPSIVSTATAESGAAYVFRRAGVGSPWLFEAYLKASNNFPNPPGVGDAFGASVAISGDTIAVGAPGEDSAQVGINTTGLDDSATEAGAVYVFVRTGTSWAQQAYIKASNAEQADVFAFAVALEGDTLVVTASREDNIDGSQNNGPDGLGTNAGAAYVFTRTGSVWSQQAYLKASGPEPASFGDGFGQAVALSGDTVAISAPGEDSTIADSGAVYVFRRTGSAWQQEAFLKMSNAGTQDLAARALALDGDTLVVGVPEEDSAATGVGGDGSDNSAQDAGAVYVFVRNGTSWSQQAFLKASNTTALANFGGTVAVNGDVIAVGALREAGGSAGVFPAGNLAVQGGGFAESGAAYLFTRVGSTWSLDAYVKATPNAPGSQFGCSLAMDDATLLVGAQVESTGGSGSGAAYCFR